MAAASTRASSTTTLALVEVEIPVSLYTTEGKPGPLSKFDTAGPNGGRLVKATVAQAAPVEDDTAPVDVIGDPLGDDPGPEERPPVAVSPAMEKATAPTLAGGVAGEYVEKLEEVGSGVIVEPGDVRRGLRLADGSFIDLTEQVAAIDEATKLDAMRVVEFIDVGQVRREQVTGSYYVATDDPEANRALRMIYEAMKLKRRVGIVKWTKRSRQALGILVPHPRTKTLMILQLQWSEDFREAPKKARAIAAAAVTEREVAMAAELVEAMSGSRETLDGLRDDAIAMREELTEKALAGLVDQFESPVVAEAETPQDFAAAMEAAATALA